MKSINEIVDKVYVLHVKTGFEEREKFINEEFKKFNIEFEYFLDYDIEDLDETELKCYYADTHMLDKPNLSIGMKHIGILKKIIENKYNRTLIFEDDVIFEKYFYDILQNVQKEILSLSSGYVISLGNAGNLYVDKKRRKKNQFLYEEKRHRAADSYIIDYTAAKRRLDYLVENKTIETAGHMFNTIDNKVGNKILWLHPTIVEQASQNGIMRSSVSRNKLFHRFRWLWRDFQKKYIKSSFG